MPPNRPVNPWARAAGLLAGPLYLTLILALGALEPGFSHRTSLMSTLGGAPGVRGVAFNLGVGTTGALVTIFSIGLHHRLPPTWTTRVGSALLMIGGLGLIGAGVFHCNQGCRNVLAEPDLVGRLHLIASLLAGMGTGLAPLAIWAAMRRSVTCNDLAAATLGAAILANLPGIVFWATVATGFRLHSVEGLIQRAGMVVVLIWIFFVAARLGGWRPTQMART
jgi:hypothetical membrane protein